MGDDEARARATLNEMQFRISEGPYTALAISETASADEVRAAFLALTKQYHPARFGRMSTDVQRLSNEVFLGIKAAHDQLMKQLGGALRGGVSQTGTMPVLRPEGSGRAPTGQNPALTRPTTQPVPRGADRPSTPAISRTLTPLQPVTRTSTPSGGIPQIGRTPTPQGMPPQARPSTPSPSQPARPSTSHPGSSQPVRSSTPAPARTTPPMGTPIQRPTTPVGARPGTPPVMRPGTPPTARPTTPPAPTSYNPDTVRHAGVPAFDERAAHREAMIQLNEQEWSNARQTLQSLAQHRPQSKNYGALLAYARGREAQKLGRASEAALEYQRALELEPDLAMAKQALAEVQRRR